MKLIFLNGMFHFAQHKCVRILLKDVQTGPGAKVDLLIAIYSAGVIRWVLEFASAGSFVFRQWGDGGFSQILVFHVM